MSKLYRIGTKSSLGNVHNFLAMDLHCSQDEVCIVSMSKYLQKIVGNFPEKIHCTRAIPENDNLFTVSDGKIRKLLPEEQAQAFHNTTAQLTIAGQGLLGKT